MYVTPISISFLPMIIELEGDRDKLGRERFLVNTGKKVNTSYSEKRTPRRESWFQLTEFLVLDN